MAEFDVVPADAGYPPLLREARDHPAVLHVRGRLDANPCVAIVGSRRCSRYGREVAHRLASGLARAGITVVSGLARGIDAAAHRGALAGGGATVAVLPAGLDTVYPARHAALARAITDQGALLSEHEPGTEVAPWRFPQRNRIIAGMCGVTVVVEAATKSGARITADLALDYDRDVLVVPGPITSPTSAGCHALLAQGAAPCTGIADVLALLPDCDATAAEPGACRNVALDLSSPERALLAALTAGEAFRLDELASQLAMGTAELLVAATGLEIRGLAAMRPGNRIERR